MMTQELLGLTEWHPKCTGTLDKRGSTGPRIDQEIQCFNSHYIVVR